MMIMMMTMIIIIIMRHNRLIYRLLKLRLTPSVKPSRI